VLEALGDDLNTPRAIAEMHALRNAAGRKALAGSLAFFGFRANAFAEWREARAPALTLPVEEIDRRIAARLSARKARDFAEADRIRDELASLGVVLKDSKDATTWEMAR
jgi:cysteinyl-tRNA synthetase